MNYTAKHQVNFADCYVLANGRTKAFIHSFLDTFLPDRQEVTTAYPVPQFSENPGFIFTSADELIEHLEQNGTEKHAVYWFNKVVSTLRGAMCIFTSDGQVIVGVYCETRYPDTVIEKAYLHQLLRFCGSTHGLILYEEPAPQDTDEFMARL